MAALGKIRKRGVTLIIIIGLALFAFIAEEMFRSCEATNNERRMQVGEVLGKKVSLQEYQALLDEYQEVLKMTQGRDNLTEEELNQAKDQVWNSLVNNAIIEDEASRLGLDVTDEELRGVLREGTNPMLLQTPFVNQQTRRFDVTLLTRFLDDYKKVEAGQSPEVAEQYRMINAYWQFIEKSLRQQLLAIKYQTLLSHSLLSNPVQAKMAFDGQNEESTVVLASIAYNTVNDNEVEAGEADLKAKYNEQKERFRQYAESRDIKYVDFQVLPSEADRAAIMASVTEAQQQLADGAEPADVVRKAQSQLSYTGIPVTRSAMPRDIAGRIDSMTVGETTAPFETTSDNTFNVVKLISKTLMPDSVEYKQIQVFDQSLDAARQSADSIYNALNASAPFDTIAKRYGQNGVSTWLTSEMYESSQIIDTDTKAYLEALNTMAVGEIRNIPMTQGNIIVQVVSRKNMVDKYVAAVVKRSIDFSKETYSAAYNKFSQFVSANQTLEGIEQNAKEFGFTVRERNDLFSSEHNIAGIRATTEALRWVFDAKVGQVSPLYECGNNDHLLVIAIEKIHPAGYRSQADVVDMLRPEVLRDKKFETLSTRLAGVKSVDEAKAKGAQVDTIRRVTFGAPAFIRATGSSEPALSGAVAATDKGAFRSEVVKGNGGAFVFQVLDKTQREGATFDEKTVEQQQRQAALQAASRFINELYTKANVVDRRYIFF